MKMTHTEAALIGRIVDRAEAMCIDSGLPFDRAAVALDLCMAHLDCPMALPVLLNFPDLDFSHDVFGIHREIDRQTGKLGCFTPRSAKVSHP